MSMSDSTHTTVGDSSGSNDDTGDERRMNRKTPEETNQVTMSFTADVSDMEPDETEMMQALASTFEDAFQECVNKNRDYSWSFLKEAEKLAKSDAYPIDSPTRAQVDGLLHRTGDKRERIMENVYGNGDASVSDEPHVTAMEVANYYFFMSLVLKHPDLAGSFLNDD